MIFPFSDNFQPYFHIRDDFSIKVKQPIAYGSHFFQINNHSAVIKRQKVKAG
jgi:hypothetical protein